MCSGVGGGTAVKESARYVKIAFERIHAEFDLGKVA